jgi:hypothetical protein
MLARTVSVRKFTLHAIRELNESTAADREQLVAKVNDQIASGKARAADADSEVKAATWVHRGDQARRAGRGRPRQDRGTR